jgi:hypothetical protein
MGERPAACAHLGGLDATRVGGFARRRCVVASLHQEGRDTRTDAAAGYSRR